MNASRVVRNNKRRISYSVRRLAELNAEYDIATVNKRYSEIDHNEIDRIRNRLEWHSNRIELVFDLLNLKPKDSREFSDWIIQEAASVVRDSHDKLHLHSEGGYF